jgi:hypothetical protein
LIGRTGAGSFWKINLEGLAVTIVLDHKKLLGFRIVAGTASGKSGAKIGDKPGEKVGVKRSNVS